MNSDPVSNAPIQSLQLMLQTISYAFGTIPVVNPDGIFGEATEQALRGFQSKYGLPVTGTADEDTFRKVTEVYTLADELLSLAQSSVIHFPAPLVISPNQHHPHVYLAQAIFSTLNDRFPEFIVVASSGTVDKDTAANIRLLQSLSGLPVTGKIDLPTWNRLNLLYRSVFDRNTLPSQG